MNTCGRAENVGVVGLEAYFPSTYVDQSDLEVYDSVPAGKYTKGLGQLQMGVCTDLEDVCSVALTVTKKLIDKYKLSAKQIGRIEVGTESHFDRSKSVKTFLMQLFNEEKNTDFAGVDVVNACFGATQALFNALDWVESGHWDGRYALVIAADIAVYDRGPARCTGGAGAIAMLIGDHAPIVFHHRVRSFHVEHVYDFYKPTAGTEYPVINGSLSIQSYFGALDRCYSLYCEKYENVFKKPANVETFDAVLFHSPYSKLVQKSIGRLVYTDLIRGSLNSSQQFPISNGTLNPSGDLSALDKDKELELSVMKFSSHYFASKTEKSLWITKRVGNMYAASLYAALVSHLKMTPTVDLPSQKILMFSYGSGLTACMFSLEIRSDAESVQHLKHILHILEDSLITLESRVRLSAGEFNDAMEARHALLQKTPNCPTADVNLLFPGTFYVTSIDEAYRRQYTFKE